MPRQGTGQGGRNGGRGGGKDRRSRKSWGVASLAGTSTQLLTKDDGSKRGTQGQKTKKRVEKITQGDTVRHPPGPKVVKLMRLWGVERHRDGRINATGIGSVSDRLGGPPTQRVSGHPWRVRAQESWA